MEPGEGTRAALIRAAEQLMAERGIDGVDLRDVNRRAGQRNSSAVHYHFGDRAGLVRAIRLKHRPPIDRRRTRMLDELEREGHLTVRSLLEALILPMARHLSTPSGRAYVTIISQQACRAGSQELVGTDLEATGSFRRVIDLLTDAIGGEEPARSLRVRQAMLTVVVLIADTANDLNHRRVPVRGIGERLEALIDLVEGALAGDAGHRTRR